MRKNAYFFLISHAKICGFRRLYSLIFLTTCGVATLGLEPPMRPGDVVWNKRYRLSILLTQPCDTCSLRLISHGLTPWLANSTMRSLVSAGNGLPFINSPPSWFNEAVVECPFLFADDFVLDEFIDDDDDNSDTFLLLIRFVSIDRPPLLFIRLNLSFSSLRPERLFNEADDEHELLSS